MADVGTGTSITFLTSSLSLQVTNIEMSGTEREAIDITHLGSTSFRKFMPGDLTDLGELSVEVNLDTQVGDSIKNLLAASAETIRITFPIPSGLTTAGKLEFTGFATGFEFALPLEEVQTGTITIKADGTTYTWTDAT